MKSSLYKVGDKVIIAQRKGEADDYPFSFVDKMASHSGEVATVSKVKYMGNYSFGEKCYNNDPYRYELEEFFYNWHSSMFEPKENNVMKQKTIIIDGVEYTCTPKEQPKKWRDNVDNIISGYFINDASEIISIVTEEENPNEDYNYNVFATKKQAKSALAMARISQIMANDERFGGAITDEEWQDASTTKYIICRWGDKIQTDFGYTSYHFLAFHTKEQRYLFLQENQDLIKDYLMID